MNIYKNNDNFYVLKDTDYNDCYSPLNKDDCLSHFVNNYSFINLIVGGKNYEYIKENNITQDKIKDNSFIAVPLVKENYGIVDGDTNFALVGVKSIKDYYNKEELTVDDIIKAYKKLHQEANDYVGFTQEESKEILVYNSDGGRNMYDDLDGKILYSEEAISSFINEKNLECVGDYISPKHYLIDNLPKKSLYEQIQEAQAEVKNTITTNKDDIER